VRALGNRLLGARPIGNPFSFRLKRAPVDNQWVFLKCVRWWLAPGRFVEGRMRYGFGKMIGRRIDDLPKIVT
jgi:hypothetical protein